MSSYVWLIAIIMFLIAEQMTLSLVSIWFAAAGIVSLILSMLHASGNVQLIAFLIVSTAGLIAIRPLVKRYFTPKTFKTNVDSTIGQTGYVLDEISNEKATGRVKLGAMEWTARSTDGSTIPVGTLVQADRVEGVKVFVTPVNK